MRLRSAAGRVAQKRLSNGLPADCNCGLPWLHATRAATASTAVATESGDGSS